MDGNNPELLDALERLYRNYSDDDQPSTHGELVKPGYRQDSDAKEAIEELQHELKHDSVAETQRLVDFIGLSHLAGMAVDEQELRERFPDLFPNNEDTDGGE